MPSAMARRHALQGAARVFDAARVVLGADAVLGDDHGTPADARGLADAGLQRLRIELVAHLRELGAVGRRPDAVLGEAHAGIGLHADEIVALERFQELAVDRVVGHVAQAFAAGLGLELVERQRDADRAAHQRFQDLIAFAMRRDQVRRGRMAVAGEVGRETSRLAAAQTRGFRERLSRACPLPATPTASRIIVTMIGMLASLMVQA